MPDTTPHASLAERFQARDPRALAEMYSSYAAPMRATAVKLLGDGELAADAVQAAFLRAWQGATSFDPSRELKPWLYSIVRRTAVDLHRRERRNRHTVPLDAVAEPAATGGTSWERTWITTRVREALDRLPDADRTVLFLAYYESLSHTEIAERLRVPLGTVKSRSLRAQRKLARALAPEREAVAA